MIGISEGIVLADRYRLVRRQFERAIGAGWVAVDTETSAEVWVQFTRHGGLEAVGELLRRHGHAGMPAVLDTGEFRMIVDSSAIARSERDTHASHVEIVIEFVVCRPITGRAMTAKVARKSLTPAEALMAVAGLAEALELALREGYSHGWLTGESVWITRRGACALDLALGLCAADGLAIEVEQEVTGCFAPERLAGGAAAEASDVFALGWMLYILLIGYAALQIEYARVVAEAGAATTVELLTMWRKRARRHIIELLGTDSALTALLVAALSERPEDRPTLAAFHPGARAAAGGMAGVAALAIPLPAPRHRAAEAAVVAGVAGAAVGLEAAALLGESAGGGAESLASAGAGGAGFAGSGSLADTGSESLSGSEGLVDTESGSLAEAGAGSGSAAGSGAGFGAETVAIAAVAAAGGVALAAEAAGSAGSAGLLGSSESAGLSESAGSAGSAGSGASTAAAGSGGVATASGSVGLAESAGSLGSKGSGSAGSAGSAGGSAASSGSGAASFTQASFEQSEAALAETAVAESAISEAAVRWRRKIVLTATASTVCALIVGIMLGYIWGHNKGSSNTVVTVAGTGVAVVSTTGSASGSATTPVATLAANMGASTPTSAATTSPAATAVATTPASTATGSAGFSAPTSTAGAITQLTDTVHQARTAGQITASTQSSLINAISAIQYSSQGSAAWWSKVTALSNLIQTGQQRGTIPTGLANELTGVVNYFNSTRAGS